MRRGSSGIASRSPILPKVWIPGASTFDLAGGLPYKSTSGPGGHSSDRTGGRSSSGFSRSRLSPRTSLSCSGLSRILPDVDASPGNREDGSLIFEYPDGMGDDVLPYAIGFS